MTEFSFDAQAEAVETFVAQVQTYDMLVEQHRDGRVDDGHVDRYITNGLVDAWMEAADAADELRDHDYPRENATTKVEGPSPRQSMLGQQRSLDYERLSHELWNEFLEAQQQITAHEQYALRNFERSPVEYRLEIDDDYSLE